VTTPVSRAGFVASDSDGAAGTPLVEEVSVAGALVVVETTVLVSRFELLLLITSQAVVEKRTHAPTSAAMRGTPIDLRDLGIVGPMFGWRPIGARGGPAGRERSEGVSALRR
jgi:hypothetical protein